MKYWIDCAELRSKVQQKMLQAMYKVENQKAQAYADVMHMIDEAEVHVCECEGTVGTPINMERE